MISISLLSLFVMGLLLDVDDDECLDLLPTESRCREVLDELFLFIEEGRRIKLGAV